MWLFLGDVDVPEVVASSRGVGVKLQRMLKRFQGAGVILLVAVDNSQQIVRLHTGGISLELFLNFFFGLFYQALAEQFFHFRKMRLDFRGLRGIFPAGDRLLRFGYSREQEN